MEGVGVAGVLFSLTHFSGLGAELGPRSISVSPPAHCRAVPRSAPSSAGQSVWPQGLGPCWPVSQPRHCHRLREDRVLPGPAGSCGVLRGPVSTPPRSAHQNLRALPRPPSPRSPGSSARGAVPRGHRASGQSPAVPWAGCSCRANR